MIITINPNRLLFPYKDVSPSSLQNVYIMDHDGAAFSFSSMKDSEAIELEIRDHMTRFHELMFNMIPDARSIDEKTSRALSYGDGSVLNFYRRIKERGYYDDIIQSSSSTEFFLDSVLIEKGIPSKVKTFGKVLSIRSSSSAVFDIQSSCIVSSVPRTSSNAHGLWIQKFSLEKFEQVDKRRR